MTLGQFMCRFISVAFVAAAIFNTLAFSILLINAIEWRHIMDSEDWILLAVRVIRSALLTVICLIIAWYLWV